MKAQARIYTSRLILNVLSHLSGKNKLRLLQLSFLMLCSGMAEAISLGAVIPFLEALTTPHRMLEHPAFNFLANYLGITRSKDIVLVSSIVFAATVVIAAIIRLANLWLNVHLAASIGSDLSCDAYRHTLYQPYEEHVARNSSTIITATTIHTTGTAAALTTLLNLMTAVFVASFLIIGMFFISWPVALISSFLFGSVYSVLTIKTGKELQSNGYIVASAAQQQIKSIQEGLGSFRDIVLESSYEAYIEIYRKADQQQRLHQAKNQFLGGFPRYVVESLGLISIAILGGALALTQKSSVVPLLGALALGAQRLLPALQQIYSSWALLKSYNADMLGILELLDKTPLEINLSSNPYQFNKYFSLQDVYFRYTPHSPCILNGLSILVRKGDRIGIVGKTGSGKSTLLDILMGLLTPTSGKILVDGTDIHDIMHPHYLASWRSSISHVPQNIYLSDSTIAENIAFGVPRDEIDMNRLKKAADDARIAGYINSLPEAYDTFVGERGIRLSGGQLQRIGIARALYKRNQIIILDEATSALDTDTEKEIMECVDNFDLDVTVIIVAHRLTTLRKCDRIISIESGIISERNYLDLSNS